MKKGPISLRELMRERHPDLTGEQILKLILGGRVRVDGATARDPNQRFDTGCVVDVRNSRTYVSRGARKLLPVLEEWEAKTEGKVFLDAGSASGGFTQALLMRGAGLVHSIDVGYNLLDYSLRRDERVRVHERTNIMRVSASDFDPPPQAAAADLSFRSLVGACAHILGMLEEQWLVCLVKPQFEWRNPDRTFRGVVRDDGILRRILHDLELSLRRDGCYVNRVAESPIRGRKGNREFFFLVSLVEGAARVLIEREIDCAVSEGAP